MTTTNRDIIRDPASLVEDFLQSTKRLYQAVAEGRDDATDRALQQRDRLIERLGAVLPGASPDQVRAASRLASSTRDLETQIDDLLRHRLGATGERVDTVKQGVRMLRGYSGRKRLRTGGAVVNQQA